MNHEKKEGFTLIEILLLMGFMSLFLIMTFITFRKIESKANNVEQAQLTQKRDANQEALEMTLAKNAKEHTPKSNDDEAAPVAMASQEQLAASATAAQESNENPSGNDQASLPPALHKIAEPHEPTPMSPANVAIIETLGLFGLLLAGLGIFARRLIKKSGLAKAQELDPKL